MIKFEAASFQQLERLLKLVDKMEAHTVAALILWTTSIDSIFKVVYIDDIMDNLEG